jgi:PIN domain nuclease of toxin-antitoxin system
MERRVAATVLDASALLALLKDEPGGDLVRPLVATAVMSTINLAEVVGHYARNGVSHQRIVEILRPLPIDYSAPDAMLAYEVGLLLPLTRAAGLSLGDRACLALARRLALPALTAERRWADVADAAGVEVVLIR